MDKIKLSLYDDKDIIKPDELKKFIDENQLHLDAVLKMQIKYSDSLGWMDIDEWAGSDALKRICQAAERVRADADVFVLIGVGGSNQAARACIKALNKGNGPKVLYAGNNLSPDYINNLISQLDGKSVYINAIAKNFETLEPGIGFRVLRQYLEKRYGEKAKERIAVTGTISSPLHRLAIDQGYDFFTFPTNIGGRYSVLSDVGLYPMAVAGLDIKALVEGAKDMRERLYNESADENAAYLYAAYRNILLSKGYNIEMLAFFEPRFDYFSKWWVQLFAESEGKQDKGLFPVAVNYTEDLHSVGQYVQDGQKMIFETFFDVTEQDSSLKVNEDRFDDGFNYLNGKDFWAINKVAEKATIDAHSEGGIPCIKIIIPKINEYYFGQLFYFFEFSCYISGSMLGINPFDQPGVENYKGYMFKNLGK